MLCIYIPTPLSSCTFVYPSQSVRHSVCVAAVVFAPSPVKITLSFLQVCTQFDAEPSDNTQYSHTNETLMGQMFAQYDVTGRTFNCHSYLNIVLHSIQKDQITLKMYTNVHVGKCQAVANKWHLHEQNNSEKHFK